MIARVIPMEEWDRLERTQIPPFVGMPPDDVSVVAVEEDGEVIACLTVIRLTHYEGLWIDPVWRGNPGVPRRLLRLAGQKARQWTKNAVIGGAEEGLAGNQMRDILERLGASRLPLEFYALPLEGERCRRLF